MNDELNGVSSVVSEMSVGTVGSVVGCARDFESWAALARVRVERALAEVLDGFAAHPVAVQSPLVAAMRHGVMNGGKRVRALAVLAAAQVRLPDSESVRLGVEASDFLALRVACALELVHAYSLIHDDLPCMDDDDLRRGQPTVHVQFGEAQALLAGDALQTLAFDVLSCPDLTAVGVLPAVQLGLLQLLARASGVAGMAGGQAIDCHHVGLPLSVSDMRTMHELKTGALLKASVMMGALCAPSALPLVDTDALSAYADDLGLLFQVVDDVLDASQDTATLGKTAGKDADANKPTYVQAMGIDGARGYAQQLYASALGHLNRLSADSDGVGVQLLADLAAYCHERIH